MACELRAANRPGETAEEVAAEAGGGPSGRCGLW